MLNSGGIFLAAMLSGEAIGFMLHHISHSACLGVFKWQWDRVGGFHKNSSTLALVWEDPGSAICQKLLSRCLHDFGLLTLLTSVYMSCG